jgi:hypothetical protein
MHIPKKKNHYSELLLSKQERNVRQENLCILMYLQKARNLLQLKQKLVTDGAL